MKAPTVRSVNAALANAGITVRRGPGRAMHNHRGELVQSAGASGTKVEAWSATEVRVIPDVHCSTSASPERRAQARNLAYAKHVAALPGFTCRVDTAFGFGLIVSEGGE